MNIYKPGSIVTILEFPNEINSKICEGVIEKVIINRSGDPTYEISFWSSKEIKILHLLESNFCINKELKINIGFK